MRYYEFTITDPVSGQNYLIDPKGLGFSKGSGPLASSLYNAQTTNSSQFIGNTNPNALNIEFDLPVVSVDTPQGNALIRLWGVGLKTIGQASNLNPVGSVYKTFTLRAGMAKGLPLANPAQSGLIAQGIVYQAFGNWTGTNQTLEIIVQGSVFPAAPISFSWPRGTSLQSALAQMFSQSFLHYTASINISPNLIAPSDQTAVHVQPSAFGQWLQRYTQRLGAQQYGDDYPGVRITLKGSTLYAYDGHGGMPAKTVALNFQDLIGQPVWIKAYTVTFQTVMRADINIFDSVTFPTAILPPFALTMPAAAFPGSPAASKSAFTGKFTVTEVHHFANFREPDASSWVTNFVALYNGT